jgi:gluconolactonase
LWKDWPQGVKTGEGSEKMKELLIPGEGWKLVAEGGFYDGPAVNEKGEVIFGATRAGKTMKVGLDGKVTEMLSDGKSSAHGYAKDGKLFAILNSVLVSYGEDGKSKVMAEGFHGNDFAIRADGGIYLTESGAKPTDLNQVWYISPAGEKKVVDTGVKFPNGICFSPDQSLLYVADYRSHWIYSYQVQADGGLGLKQKYYDLYSPEYADDAAADGMKVDSDGRLYVTTRVGIQVCDQAGRVNAIIPTPNGKASNVAFGGADFSTLYATCGDRVYSRKLKVHGLNPAEGPVKPKAPKL